MSKSACRDLEQRMDPFVDGELAPSDMVTLQAHVEDCSHCSERVEFERAMRLMVRAAVTQTRAPASLRARVEKAMAEAREAEDRPTDVISLPPRLLSWRLVGPMAAAAGLALVVGALAGRTSSKHAESASANSASVLTMDSFLDDLVDQHAHPLPPETTNPTDVPSLDRFVGVPVHVPTFPERSSTTFIGGRVVPVHQQRAAMIQYMLNGRRVSMYVYNPSQIQMVASPKLREHRANNAPVYVGWVRGYSVAVTDKRGVGYALASDLDEQEASRILVAAGP